MKIVVIGGTGLVGSQVVAKLCEHGHEAIAAAPNTGVNTLTGEGLPEVLQGADVVVDVSNSPSFEDQAVLEFFETTTGNLLAAEKAAGVQHHVALSVVGTQRMAEKGYFKAKARQEQLIVDSGIPYSIVHATQFFEFLKAIAELATDHDTVRLPPVLFQPMASEDVAAAVGRTAVGRRSTGSSRSAARSSSAWTSSSARPCAPATTRATVITDPDALYFGDYAVDDTTLVPADGALVGAVRFQDWLERQLAAA